MPRQAYPLLQCLVISALLAGVLFGCAGRWDVPMFWAYVGVFGGFFLIAALTVYDPGLAKERTLPGAGGKDWLFVIGRLFMPAHYAVAGLDVGRFQWSATVPLQWQIVGLVGVTISLSWIWWSVAVNRFFSPVIRIQKERGHQLVTNGPFRFMRHPAYAALILFMPFSTLALGSWLSILPAAAFAILIVRRTILEDRFLQKELEGYADYAKEVHYRLFPGIW